MLNVSLFCLHQVVMRIKLGKVDGILKRCEHARQQGSLETFLHQVSLSRSVMRRVQSWSNRKGLESLLPAQQLCFRPVHYIPGSLRSHCRAEFMTSGGGSHSVLTRATALALGNFREMHVPSPFQVRKGLGRAVGPSTLLCEENLLGFRPKLHFQDQAAMP